MTQPQHAILAKLLVDLPIVRVEGDPETVVTDIADDSRRVGNGSMFVALRGQQFDGHRFIPDVVARGASVVVCQEFPAGAPRPQAVVQVEDSHKALGRLASGFFGHPSRKLQLIGVTGTDGKTSTTLLTAAILRAAGKQVGHATTVEVHDSLAPRPNMAGFTTLQAMELQSLLRDMVDAGAQAAVLEVSSHALATERVEGCEFDVAVFTNLASEHLDFHHTVEEYRRQKARLFDMLGPTARHKPWESIGVVNADDPEAAFFAAHCARPKFCGIDHAADVRATGIRCGPQGSRFTLETAGGSADVETRLLGRFNVRNWLAAATAGLAAGAALKDVAQAASLMEPVPGRMEQLDYGQPFSLYVDFAHTPQGLSAALQTLREISTGRTIAVFGHAGRRDTNHRRGLVEVAKAGCDLFILTTDDPYDEDPAAILEHMRQAAIGLGCREGQDFLCVADRRAAFQTAFDLALPGDAVLLAGRGHETTIPLGKERIPFHDATVARELLVGV